MFTNFLPIFSIFKKMPSLSIPLLLFCWSCFLNFLDLKALGVLLGGFLEVGFNLNEYSSYFFTFCSFIGGMVVFFSYYYMKESEVGIFSLCLTLFIVFMLLLTSSLNVLSMFLGWEGVGLMSFLLIGWYSARPWAGEGSKKAVLFNRLTDFFFLFIIVLEMGSPLWTFSLDSSSPSVNFFPWLLLPLAFLMSTLGKSAQFMFHPWLTSAMEGPTPVSSLLHSSTMVVAGVYLYLFFHPLFWSGGWGVTISSLSVLSCLTLLGSSFWALSQEDVKKVVALSTTSQLSLMMVIISLNLPELAFFHMVLHGFFKALIFMGSGVCIHSGSNSQDFRNTNLSHSQNSLTVCFLLGNMGLMGFPFIGAFFSKHSILSFMSTTMWFSSLILFSTFFSFSLTVGYSMKVLISVKSSVKLPLKGSGEGLMTMMPLLFLSLFTMSGFMGGGLVDFLVSPSALESGVLKWSFFLIIILGGWVFFNFNLSSPSIVFSFSSFLTIFIFFKKKIFKFFSDFLGEKQTLLLNLKSSGFRLKLHSLPSPTFRELPNFSLNFINLFSMSAFLLALWIFTL